MLALLFEVEHSLILTFMLKVPGINQEDLIKFDNKIMTTTFAFGEKAKKDMFKKMISQLIGKDMAKLFQKEIIIKNLPQLHPLKVSKIFGTGISCKEKIRKEHFQICLSLSFYIYKIVFKVRISSPL